MTPFDLWLTTLKLMAVPWTWSALTNQRRARAGETVNGARHATRTTQHTRQEKKRAQRPHSGSSPNRLDVVGGDGRTRLKSQQCDGDEWLEADTAAVIDVEEWA